MSETKPKSPDDGGRGGAGELPRLDSGAEFTSAPRDEEEPRKVGTPFLVLQFFVFPMAIVAACVIVFLVFGLIASEGRGARDYLDEVKTGSANRRWQAAFELSKVLQAGKDPALRDPAFGTELIRVFEQVQGDDPRVRRFLVLAMARLGDPRAVPVLRDAARGSEGSGAPDAQTQVYAILALGVLKDEAALPDLLELARREDAGLRKAAVHALGAFAAPAAREAVAVALSDPVEDVRWNAALALGRAGDPRATPVLLLMMDRAHLASVPGLTEPQQDEAVMGAVQSAAHLADPALRAALERLRAGDPNLKVREAARLALGGSAATAPPVP
jgi:HEAT repeat protein